MRPDAVAADVSQYTMGDVEIASAFFKQDSTGGVVPAVSASRSAVLHAHSLDADEPRTVHQNRKTRDVHEPDVGHSHLIYLHSQDAIRTGESSKGRSIVRQTAPVFQPLAVAVNRKPGEADALGPLAAKNRAPAE